MVSIFPNCRPPSTRVARTLGLLLLLAGLVPSAALTGSPAPRTWWSLTPLRRPDLPEARDGGLHARHPVDLFLARRLERAGLTFSPPASRRVLCRRVTLDLTGLPPTPGEVEAFLADRRPDAYERLVDRLLASPAHGERWARHWLDVVRFGESHGFEYNQPRDRAWPYRNWVIEALNEDLPYDRFARWQIAGDLLAPEDPSGVVATGFLVAGPHNTTLPSNDTMRRTMRQDEMEDLVGTLSQGFLGMTVHCARCHDHKFDPIPQRDYYRVVAALAGVRPGERDVPDPRAGEREREATILEERREEVRREIRALLERARSELARREGDEPSRDPLAPTPDHHFDFTRSLEDRAGDLALELRGGARRDGGGLHLEGNGAYARSGRLPAQVAAKTLMARVVLADLEQRGGAAISLQTPGGAKFDAIVFGEREVGRWMAGSDHFHRTRSLGAPPETEAASRAVHVALVYEPDGTIRAYREGAPHGDPYRVGLQEFEPGQSELLFGLRHEPASPSRLLRGTILEARLFLRALGPEEVAAAARGGAPARKHLVDVLGADDRRRLESLEARERDLTGRIHSLREVTLQKAYAVKPGEPGKVHVLLRGDVNQPADEVSPGGVAALVTMPADFGLDSGASEGARRRALAQWVGSPENPLLSRVIVNRLWLHHFGAGLVNTPSDFGTNGEPPSHPELLEWLASELVESGFSLKAIHRLLVTSRAYRQASLPVARALAVDADNRLLWRKTPRRLEAEALRDSLIQVSGLLDRQLGGEGYRDVKHYVFRGSHFYDPVKVDVRGGLRRTIHRFRPRGARPTILETFDCPDPSTATARRATTTTPLQALALLNHELLLDLADALARDLEADRESSLESRLREAHRRIHSREPTGEELELAREHVEAHGLPAYLRVLFNTSEFLFVR